MNEDSEFDPKDFIDNEKLIEIWSKIEVANMMISRANGILAQAAIDLKFYNMISEYNDK
jgi:hypothetical protein